MSTDKILMITDANKCKIINAVATGEKHNNSTHSIGATVALRSKGR